MSPPLVSVLLPCFNCADTLPGALGSLLAQDMGDFEVLAVDDGSTDHTADVLRRWAGLDRRVKPVSLPHRGIVPALNAGLDLAQGRYVARMDGDDACAPGRFSAQVGLLEERPDAGLASCLVEYGGDRAANGGYAHYVDWINTLVTPEEISLNRFVESPLAHPSVMFRSELPARHGPYRDGEFPEDYEFWLRLAAAGVGMAKVPETLLVWNDPPDRLSRTDPRYSVDAFYAMKAGYLAAHLARTNPRHPEITVVGAGRTSRKRAERLEGHGIRITHYVDIDPKKVGRVVHGRPVLHREELPEPGRMFLVSFVASRGARQEIEDFLASRGHCPGLHYLMAA